MTATEGEAGLADLERAVVEDPGSAQAQYELAEALGALERWDEALARYRSAIELDPQLENAQIGAGDALLALGRFDEALVQFEAARTLLPGSRGLNLGLTWLLAAGPDASLRDGERAVHLAQFLWDQKSSLAALELMAAAQAQAGNCLEAARLQRAAVAESMHHETEASVTSRLASAVEWFEGTPCGVPEGRPVSERPHWPRAETASESD